MPDIPHQQIPGLLDSSDCHKQQNQVRADFVVSSFVFVKQMPSVDELYNKLKMVEMGNLVF